MLSQENQQKIEKIDKLNSLIADVTQLLLLRRRDEATEEIVSYLYNTEQGKIYTTRDDATSEMWIYREGIYVPHGKTYICEICRKILMQAYTTNFANSVINKIEADTYIDSKIFFNKKYKNEIATKNGILDVITGALIPHTPDKIFFKKIPILYNPSCTCKNIHNFFKKIVSEENINTVYEMFGYCLINNYPIEKAFLLIGNGRNGKSKLTELLKIFLGRENCSYESLKSIEKDQWSAGELFGKFANISGELQTEYLRDVSIFKRLTGNDEISASRKFLSKIYFQNSAKLIFCANELPLVFENTSAFWERWISLNFPNKFIPEEEYNTLSQAEKDKGTADGGQYYIQIPDIVSSLISDSELSGLLNNALVFLQNIQKNKSFTNSQEAEEIKIMWMRKSNSFLSFCAEKIEEDFEGKIKKSALKKNYQNYCKKHKLKMASDIMIKRTLSEQFGAGEEYIVLDGDSRTWAWIGIKIKINFLEA